MQGALKGAILLPMRPCRSATVTIISAAILLMATGCGDRKNSSEPTAVRSTESSAVERANPSAIGQNTDAEIARDLAKFVLQELPHLRDGAPLAAWKQLHNTDTIEPYASGVTSVEKWCARATSEASLDPGRKWVRSAYFYVPDVPMPAVLPASISGSKLVDECRLGLIWSEIEDTDVDRAGTLGREARESLVKPLGEGNNGVKLQWWGSAFWRNSVLWKNERVSIVTAITSSPTLNPRETIKATRVFVAAAGPAKRTTFEPSTHEDVRAAYVAKRQLLASRIDEAVTIAALGSDVEQAIKQAQKLISVKDGWSQHPTIPERTAIFTMIDQWLTAARTLPPPRRAAALFVADQLLDQSGGPFWGENQSPPIRQQLEAQGAEFEWLHLGDTYNYTHTWLKEAWRADPEGRAGELAFLTLVERGFETSGQCLDQHGISFRAVIREGEEYLQRKPDSVLSADIHFLVAQAYGDIVTLAGGKGDEAAQAAEYQAESSSARSKAIDHYRIALESAPNDPRIPHVWPDAWRLIAGIAPTETHFYCIYD